MKRLYFLFLLLITASTTFALAPSADLGVVSLDNPTTPMCPDKPDLIVTVKNYSASKHDFAVDKAVITVSVSGASTGTYTLSIATGTISPGGTEQFTVVSPIDLTTSGTHKFYITIDVLNGDANNSNDALPVVNIVVHPLPTVTLAAFSPVCLNTPAFTLSGGSPSGGVYTGSGVSGGIFTASAAGTGNKTITYRYTDGNGCSNAAQKTITVRALPTVTHSTLSSICADVPAFNLSGGSPIGGTYSGTGVSAGMFDPAVSGAGTFTVTYVYTDVNGCTSSATPTQTVDTVPNVTFSTIGYVCLNAAPIALTQGSPAGGTYSGTGVSGGMFDPSVAAAIGTFTVDYSFTDGNGCSAVATQTVDVYDIPTVSHSTLGDICEEAGTLTLSGGSPTGGSYSGTGVSGGIFDPMVSGPGTFTLTYTYTDGFGCSNDTFSIITVNPTPVVTLSSLSDICTNGMAFSLSGGSPAGGTYSGTGVSGGSFDPAVAMAGSHVISYIYIDGTTSCTDTATQTITVYTAPSVGLIDTAFCEGSIMLDAGNAGATYAWSTGATTQTITLSASDTVNVIVTDANNCSATDTAEVIYQPLPSVTLALTTSYVCYNAPAFSLSGGSPAGGTYSGTGVSAGAFDPTVTGVGNFTVTYVYVDPLTSCTDTAHDVITVGCDGIAKNEIPDLFNLYSNLTHNTISVVFNVSLNENIILVVTDVQGKNIYTENIQAVNSGTTQTINTSSFADGLYFVNIKTATGYFTKKAFVQH